MKGKSKLAAVGVLAAAATIFGACRADDTAGVSGGSQAASKNTAAVTVNNTAAKPSPSVVAQAPAEVARRVTTEELKKMLDSGKAVVYDTRAKAAYDAEHIKGSLSMPSNEVADRAGELPKDKTIIFYCT
jgi:3-mercaptopyruvate sulfurtransferase SseA